MRTKKLTPRNSAPVKRENVATVSTDANAIRSSWWGYPWDPCAADDAE